jgi:D-lactate dehydrogenase (cytochrome)
MDKILALHDDDLDVVVQPSIGWMKLNEEIKDSGLFFPVVRVISQPDFTRAC